MAPVENSLAGSIHAVWDLLALYKPAIVGEIYYHVRHCLIGHPAPDSRTSATSTRTPRP